MFSRFVTAIENLTVEAKTNDKFSIFLKIFGCGTRFLN